jgi:hypothetical protein
LHDLMAFRDGILFRLHTANISIIRHLPFMVQISMCAPDLDTTGVGGEIIVAQLASGFARANVSPVKEESLRPSATRLLEPVEDKDLGMDNMTEGAAGPLSIDHLVQVKGLLHSLSQVQILPL